MTVLDDRPGVAGPVTPGDRPGIHPRGRAPRRPGWSRPAFAAVTGLAAVLYIWDLSRNGLANQYYAAEVRSATVSWKAFFFGSLDPGSFITVDKPPFAFWVQALSARAFGFSSWSILLPEALAGVASVVVLHHLVRKWAGDLAGLLAALGMTLTPVAVVMFRFNNPDAMLTLLLLLAAWATWAAIETGRTRHLVVAGVLMGLAFDTKMLQAFLVLPALAGVYLWAGKPRLRTRLTQLAAGGAALLVAGGWWVTAVALWPAASRPFIGSTSDNSILSLIFGYNGLSRIFGSGAPGAGSGAGFGGGRGGGPTFGGAAGWLRLFDSELGGQISWLLPLAGAGLLAGLWHTRRGSRTDTGRAGYLLWGGWAVVTFAVFSQAKGTFHPYYAVALAPAIAALAGAGSVSMWQIGRQHRLRTWLLPAAVLASAALAVVLLRRSAAYDTWLIPVIVAGAALAAVGLLVAPWLRHRVLAGVAGGVAAVTLLAGPAAYAVTTVGHAATGSTPSAGPAVAGGGFGGRFGLGGRLGFGGGGFGRGAAGGPQLGSTPFGGSAPGGATSGPGGLPTEGTDGAGGGFGAGGIVPSFAGGGPGGAGRTDTALDAYLLAHRGSAKYLVAVQGAGSAESIILATGKPVIAMGGFTGSDPAPSLAGFEHLVKAGQVRYVLLGSQGGGGPGGGQGTAAIATWVEAHGTVVSYGSTTAGTLYLVSG